MKKLFFYFVTAICLFAINLYGQDNKVILSEPKQVLNAVKICSQVINYPIESNRYIDLSTNTNQDGPAAIKTSTGTDWGTKNNWSPKGVPAATDFVIINSNMTCNPGAGYMYQCASLTINNGFTLSVSPSQLDVNGTITNNGTLTLNAGTSSEPTYLTFTGNFINTGTFTATALYTSLEFTGTTAQSFTNNGTVTAPMYSITLGNTAGLTLLGNNQIICTRVNLFYGTITNSNKITLGNGGSTYGVVQIGGSATNAAGAFDKAPTFNPGDGGIQLLYAPASTNYSTSYEVPPDGIVAYFYVVCSPRTLSMSRDITIPYVYTTGLDLSSGNLSIGAHTLRVNGIISTSSATIIGGTYSNIIFSGIPSTTLPAVSGGLNNLTINSSSGIFLGGAVTVYGTLTLTSGIFNNGSNLTMASGSTISRSGGILYSAPTFTGIVNLIYTGSSSITTGKELPTGISTLSNLTTNTGGVTQYTYSTSTTNLLTDLFNDGMINWTGNFGTGTNTGYYTSTTTNAGGVSPEAIFYSADLTHSNASYYIYRSSLNTTGYSAVNVSFKSYATGNYTQNYPTYLKLQSSTSSSGPWHDVWSMAYTPHAATNIVIPLYTTDVGSGMYFQFAFAGDPYALDGWYFDNFVVDGVTPVASNIVVNGTLDLTNGNYTIGSSNTLGINGTVTGTGTITGSANSNLSIGGTGSVGALNFTSGSRVLNNLTLNRTSSGLVTFGTDLLVDNIITLTNGRVDMGSNTLTLGTNLTSIGTLNPVVPTNASYIIGNFERWIPNTVTSDIYFPVGSSGQFRQAIIKYTTASSGGRLKVSGYETNPGSTNTINITELGTGYVLDRYSQEAWWKITTSDVTGGIYNISVLADVISGVSSTNFNKLRVLKRTNSTSEWTLTGTHSDATGSSTHPLVKRTGLSGFSEFGIGGYSVDGNVLNNAPLPIQLSSFTSSPKERNVNLDWVTASEINNAGFEIQRTEAKVQNSGFSKIGFVSGKGTVNTPTHYTFEDKKLQTGKYNYRLKQIDANGNFEYYALNGDVEIGVPNKFNISQNYPNPFNPITKIDFDLPFDSKVNIVLYDMTGREVKTLVNESRTAGYHTVQFNASDLSSGMYFYRIITKSSDKDFIATKKMALVK